MSKFIAIHAVADVARWKSFDAERTTSFAPFATEVTSYTDPNGGKTVALTVNGRCHVNLNRADGGAGINLQAASAVTDFHSFIALRR
jgi:hypothetical protein